MIISINPATGKIIQKFEEHTRDDVHRILDCVSQARPGWMNASFKDRSNLFEECAVLLIRQQREFAEQITLEMGKPIKESLAEVEKCAWVCRYYAKNAHVFLKDEIVKTDAGESYVSFAPLGTILAIMPWNFPFWQVFRFAAPGLMGGNTAVLKHASNVTGCSLAIESIFCHAGFPDNVFRSLVVSSHTMREIIADDRISAVTLTGSESAGSQTAAAAGTGIKKTVLELGGSDPFIVLRDVEMKTCIHAAMTARFLNAGQSCIAAKRFIVEADILEEFTNGIIDSVRKLVMGDPLEETTDIGPLARSDLLDELHYQVKESELQGAKIRLGGKRSDRPGYYYEPTVMTGVTSEMTVFQEETFGPVVVIIPATDADDAVMLANDSQYGLGASLWTTNLTLAKGLVRNIQAGSVFVNGVVKSDPRLPFGGIKKSGYGRELSHYGIREFQNIKSVWIK